MIKSEEIVNPNSCLNKAGDDEMVFVVRAKDPAFRATIMFWVLERVRMGVNHPADKKLLDALKCAMGAQ
jgi:hypothetical protein